MESVSILVPIRPLQDACLTRVVELLPQMVDAGLFALPSKSLAHECLTRALRLYASPAMAEPALPVHRIFHALRHSDLPVFNLLGLHGVSVAALEALGPDRFADFVGAYLAAHSQHSGFEEIAVSSSHVANPRALSAFLAIVSLAARSEELKALTLRGSSVSAQSLSEAHILEIAHSVNGLSVLRLPGLKAVNDSNIVPLLEAAGPGLLELDIGMTGITSKGLAAGFSHGAGPRQLLLRNSLRFLDISATSIDATALLCLIGMGALEELRLGWTPVVDPTTHHHQRVSNDIDLNSMLGSVIGTGSMPCLKRLDLSGATVDLTEALRGATLLEDVSLLGANLDCIGLNVVSSLPEGVRAVDMSQITGDILDVASIFTRYDAAPLRSLRMLKLSDTCVTGLPADSAESDPCTVEWETNGLTTAFRDFGELWELDISGTSLLSSNSIVAILGGCYWSIRVLRLRNVRRKNLFTAFTNRSKISVILFPELKEIDLSESSFGDEASGVLSTFLTYACHVTCIRLAGTSGVRDDVLGLLELFASYTIEELDLSRTAVTSRGLDSWKRSMPNLKHLDFRDCGRIDRAALVTFCRRAPELQNVLTAYDARELGLGHASRRALRAEKLVKDSEEARFIPEWRRRWRSSF